MSKFWKKAGEGFSSQTLILNLKVSSHVSAWAPEQSAAFTLTQHKGSAEWLARHHQLEREHHSGVLTPPKQALFNT